VKRQTTYFVTAPGGDERQYQVESLEGGRYRVATPDGRSLEIDAFAPAYGQLHLLSDGHSFDVDVRNGQHSYHVQLRGESHQLEVLNERQKRMAAAGAGARKDAGPDLLSPMAGRVVALSVKPGDVVTQGQTVIIVEAMKMENDLKAHRDGTIARIHVSEGGTVEIGDILVSIED
jgi:biotin carboxyl carrier protein